MADWPPAKNASFFVVFPFYDSSGCLVKGASAPAACVMDATGSGSMTTSTCTVTELSASAGVYRLRLTATEMNADIVAWKATTTTASARDAADAANLEDYRANAYGWPFAHNYAAAIDEREADDFAAAGFIVAQHEPSGQVYAGIDGGGYDFLEAHWSRVYLRVRLYGTYALECIYVPTRDGSRRVVRA